MALYSNELKTGVETDIVSDNPIPRKYKIAYTPIVTFTYIHLAALIGIYHLFFKAKWETIIFDFILYMAADIGITAGAHRLWSHRSYKAKMPLQIILMLFNTLAFQNTAFHWVRDHRQHHKYSDTDKDPHNARRGIFYSHIGWLLTRKSDEVIEGGKDTDLSDVNSNPVLCFQKKYAAPLFTIICFVFPTVMPVYLWGEDIYTAWYLNMLRYAINLNVIFLINSAAHAWGCKPYDKNIAPVQNCCVSILNLGEGFHNYHHVFPWDYKAAELGNNALNITTLFIDFFAWIGWAYDLKTVSEKHIESRAKSTGDGSDLWGNLKEEIKLNDNKSFGKVQSQ